MPTPPAGASPPDGRVRRRTVRAALLFAAALAVLSVSRPGAQARGGESSRISARGLRVPEYRDGALRFELLAVTASGNVATDCRLEGVTINVYETPPEADAAADGGGGDAATTKRPPLRYRITGNRGRYEFRTGRARLMGNVKAERFVNKEDQDGTVRRVRDAELSCPEAVWEDAARQLLSSGHVTLVRPNGDVLEGEDLVYTMADPDSDRPETVQLKRNVTMIVHSMDGAADPIGAAPDPAAGETAPLSTHIDCEGTAWYRLDDGTLHFSDNVVVTRSDDQMQSDRLKVVMGRDEKTGASRVRTLHAENNVRIRGRQLHDDGTPVAYRARGEHAVYDAAENLLFLKGTAEDLPEVRYAAYWIRDEAIVLNRRTGLLTATGEDRPHGQGRLTPPGDEDAEAETTHITYDKRMNFDLRIGVARFVGGVTLRHPRLDLESEELAIRTPEKLDQRPAREGDGEGLAGGFRHVRRITALRNVVIRTRDGRRATASKAVFDTVGGALTLTGPPDPVIEQPGQFRIRAPRITSTSFGRERSRPEDVQNVNTDGPGEMVFFVRKREDAAAARGPAVSLAEAWREDSKTHVSYKKSMAYDQDARQAVFDGEVVLTHGELVLNTKQLEVLLDERENVARRDGENDEDLLKKTGLRISKLVARNDVEMHAGGRHAAAARMVYDIRRRNGNPDPSLTLLGERNVDARIWEEGGSALHARRIVDRQNEDRVEADGPGKLTLAESGGARGRVPRTARIHFDRRFVYSAVPQKPAQAHFFGGVKLRWQDMTIDGERLDAVLGRAGDAGRALRERAALGERDEPGLLERKIETAVMTGDVVVESGAGRKAMGDQAIMLQRNAQLKLTAEDGKAELRDAQGLRLVAPSFVLYQDKSLLLANGPGKMCIAGDTALRAGGALGLGSGGADASGRGGELPGSHPLDYTLTFERRMIYSFTDRRLRFEKNVELRQLTLYGRCEELEALLTTDESRRSDDPETQGLTLGTAECKDTVRFRRYEPPTGTETLREVLEAGASTERPGHTALIQCERAVFDVQNRKVTFYDSPEADVRILEQDVERGKKPVRRYYHNVERAILESNGAIQFPHGARRPQAKYLPGDGPLRWPD